LGDRLQGCRLLRSSEGWLLDSGAVAAFASAVFRVPFALQGRLVQDGINEPALFLWRCERRRSFLFCFFQSLRFFRAMCRGGALALSKFHLSQSLRGGEAQSVEHPVPSNSTEVTHQSFVLVLRDRSDHFVSPALNHNRVNSCKVEEAQDINNKAGR